MNGRLLGGAVAENALTGEAARPGGVVVGVKERERVEYLGVIGGNGNAHGVRGVGGTVGVSIACEA